MTEAHRGRSNLPNLVDLACEMGSHDYLRSEDSVAAAGFVVSDAAEAIWTAGRAQHGVTGRRQGHGDPARDRAANLALWQAMLLERVIDTEYEPLLDALLEHAALVGSERAFLAFRLAHLRGDDESVRRLIATCLKHLPGHSEYWEFALVLGSSPSRPRERSTLAERWASHPRRGHAATYR